MQIFVFVIVWVCLYMTNREGAEARPAHPLWNYTLPSNYPNGQGPHPAGTLLIIIHVLNTKFGQLSLVCQFLMQLGSRDSCHTV